jgi:integral membrane sensor domain MASE1
MPVLASILASLFTTLFGLFGRFFALEKAASLALWGMASIAIAALYATFNNCVGAGGACAAGLSSISTSHEYFSIGLGIVFNSVTFAAVNCYMAVWIICQTYVIKKKAINLMNGAA